MNTIICALIKRSPICYAFLTAVLCVSAPSFAQLPGKIHFGILYPLSTNGTRAPADTNILSFHLIAGVSAAEQGLSVSGFSNMIRKEARGTQIAGFSNYVGGKVQGIQLAGFANLNSGSKGMMIAGFANTTRGNVKGVQFAGFANVAIQMEGAQFAGFMNIVRKIKGPQFSGFANIAHGKENDAQFAGFINRGNAVNGVQIAGFINIAKKVKGPQISGFINIADSSDYPVGIINLIKNGNKGFNLSMDETQTTLLSFQSGGKRLYGLFGLGYNHKNKNEVYAMELGVGACFFPNSVLNLHTELAAQTLENFKAGEYFKMMLRLMPALTLFHSIELSGAPTLNFVTTNTREGRLLHPKNISNRESERNNRYHALYWGYQTRFRVIF